MGQYVSPWVLNAQAKTLRAKSLDRKRTELVDVERTFTVADLQRWVERES